MTEPWKVRTATVIHAATRPDVVDHGEGPNSGEPGVQGEAVQPGDAGADGEGERPPGQAEREVLAGGADGDGKGV